MKKQNVFLVILMWIVVVAALILVFTHHRPVAGWVLLGGAVIQAIFLGKRFRGLPANTRTGAIFSLVLWILVAYGLLTRP